MILCLGTTPAVGKVMVFEALRLGGVNRASRVREIAAGKAVNASKVALRLGHRVVVTGFVGGLRGAQLCGALDRAGIEHRFVEVRSQTRLCVTVIDRAGSSHTELIEESGPVQATDVERLLGELEALLAEASILTLSGTLAPGVPEDFYARCVRLAADAGVGTIVDAKGGALKLSLPEGPLLVKQNFAELEQTSGERLAGRDALFSAMRRLARAGARNVVVTMGRRGAFGFDGSRFLQAVSPRVRAVSTIGSGDALCGAMAATLADGLGLEDALGLGVACGAANALTEEAAEFDMESVERLRAGTVVRSVASQTG